MSRLKPRKPGEKRGRPTTYTEKVASLILERVSKGDTLRAVCRDEQELDETFPDECTVRSWYVHDINGFYTRYAKAREAQAEAWSDEIVEVADQTSRDTLENKEGDPIPNNEWIARSRLRVDTRKWLMAKLHPRSYGDKIEQQITGKDGGPLVVTWQQPS